MTSRSLKAHEISGLTGARASPLHQQHRRVNHLSLKYQHTENEYIASMHTVQRFGINHKVLLYLPIMQVHHTFAKMVDSAPSSFGSSYHPILQARLTIRIRGGLAYRPNLISYLRPPRLKCGMATFSSSPNKWHNPSNSMYWHEMVKIHII